jgi:AcrR family transcriptional regulator
MRFIVPRLQPWYAAMPRITRARADARRHQIIEAALTCFARKGFHKTTMQDVVEQSGLSPGSIYCHFAGKQDIIVAVVEERHRRERALLGSTEMSANRMDADMAILIH